MKKPSIVVSGKGRQHFSFRELNFIRPYSNQQHTNWSSVLLCKAIVYLTFINSKEGFLENSGQQEALGSCCHSGL